MRHSGKSGGNYLEAPREVGEVGLEIHCKLSYSNETMLHLRQTWREQQ